ncbi:hypothetical protein NBRC116590_09320 [Pelagimonas sp. KU-00592-HH]|uniref:hypothetical protein n=1 Tax=Pelagimonas sp. KU-00592-HH TaxID=3127651 RepID=UPI0031069D92
MSDSYEEFRDRVARIYDAKGNKKPMRASRSQISVDHDGYVVIRSARRGPQVPWTGILMLAVAFFGVKGAVMSRLGPDFYGAQAQRLEPASVLEQVGAWTMRPDPVSRWVAAQISSLS